MSKVANLDYKKHFTFIKDRPFNDKVYKISVSKLRKLGWTENKVFDKEIYKLIGINFFII